LDEKKLKPNASVRSRNALLIVNFTDLFWMRFPPGSTIIYELWTMRFPQAHSLPTATTSII